jgi:benzoate membrane transport protein
MSFIGIGAAFWALLAGLLVREFLKDRTKPQGKAAG